MNGCSRHLFVAFRKRSRGDFSAFPRRPRNGQSLALPRYLHKQVDFQDMSLLEIVSQIFHPSLLVIHTMA